MKKYKIILPFSLALAVALTLIAGNILVSPIPVMAHHGNPHLVRTFIGPDGQEIDELIFPGKPPAVKEKPAKLPQPNLQMGINYVSGLVPAFDWSYGCSATSAAMLFGYYDNIGYNNMYTGPTNDGVCPETNQVWGAGECPLSATHQNVDGLTGRGHVDDYWISYLDPGPDPYVVNGWPEHILGDCTGDYMGTNQAKYDNVDGGTTFYFYTNGRPLYDYTGSEPDRRDGGHGMKLFAESREYDVTTTFNQYIRGQGTIRFLGFTFADYVAEIDAGRPVLIQVSGHTMLGFGYNTTGNLVYLHDTWDHASHTMTWGGSYAGMQHYGVTVLQLAQNSPTLTVTINQAEGQADPTNTSHINFSVVFSASVTGFEDGDVTLSGTAGPTTATVMGNGTTYNVAVSGMTSDGSVIANIAAGVAEDADGNTNTASTSIDNTVTYDTTGPTVTINQASGQVDPTSITPIYFTVVFSEPVSDFATGDVTLDGTAGATTATITGSGTTYNAAVSGMSSSGTVIASIAAGKAHDSAGNANTASSSVDNEVTFDNTAPAIPIVTGVEPNNGEWKQTLDVAIIGTNLSDVTAVSFGTRITVNYFTVNSSTQVTANISIRPGATIGSRDVSVTTPAGTGTLTGGFFVYK